MPTLYEYLREKRGREYSAKQIKEHSYLHKKPNIDKPAGSLAGRSRVWGDASNEVQDRIIDILVEIGVRYKLAYRDIAHLLLFCRVESGFNPDAAAGTTSAAGLGQYTVATVEEAAKDHISKKRLNFNLDLSGDYVFDAERGAYGVVLSYMICKERAIKYFGKDWEKHAYLFHHESWYLKPTAERMETKAVKEVQGIISAKILPHLDNVEALLSKKGAVSFKLLTRDEKPYVNQPYVAIVPPAASKKKPASVQADKPAQPTIIKGRTDGSGKTQEIETPGLAEVLFVILNHDYKQYLNVTGTVDNSVHVVKKNETLGRIAAESGKTVEELQRLNNISNPNKIKEGQVIRLHEGDYLWRRPPMELIGSYLSQFLNMSPAAAPAIVEHKRSHIVLPDGNAAQRHGDDKKVVAIRGGATSEQVAARAKAKDIPHKTVEKDIKKKVEPPPARKGKVLREGLLFPVPYRSTLTYHTNERQFGYARGGGRKHGGCDLYAPLGTPVKAMADGKIIQAYPFYWATWAIEVDHGDFIARYGEVAPMSMKEAKALKGKEVSRGDQIGTIGQLIQPSGKKYKHTMLHLELYSTTKSTLAEPLTISKLPYKRRSDLVDPTFTLDKCVDK
jgi:murein DD-endopeptidase MepM/ murein hydrolase activator NlpD